MNDFYGQFFCKESLYDVQKIKGHIINFFQKN